ncbi:hypothetical protein FRC09_010311 [Ceratobasidium sp. 395]|nr:hypothetical protein FRC09_010311 [Ceratobasidium sp. 395]
MTASARKEVLSGYQSSTLPSTSTLHSASTSFASGSQGHKGFLMKGRAGSVPKGKPIKLAKEKMVTISGLFFIPYAYLEQYKIINNAGVLLISCPSLSKVQKVLLVDVGYARTTSKGDPVELDKNLDVTGTANLLACLFPTVYEVYCAENDYIHLPNVSSPVSWFFELNQHNHSLDSNVKSGTAMKELIAGGHTVVHRAATREIFLAHRKGKVGASVWPTFPKDEEDSDSNPLAENDGTESIKQESDDDVPLAKRWKVSSPGSDSELALESPTPEGKSSSNPEPAGPSSLQAAPLPVPTVNDSGDSDAEVEATSTYLARSLSIHNIPPFTTGWSEALIPGGLATELGLEDDFDPFTDNYAI